MKTQRRWIKSVIAAASDEQVMLPWARRRMAPQSAKAINLLGASKSPQTAQKAA